MVKRILPVALLLLFAQWSTPAGAVPKTDIITLNNGDVITCEIKEMVRGKLRVKTDDMGTLSIKWDKISHIQSHYWFLVTQQNGSLIYGQMSGNDEPGQLTINMQEKMTTIPLREIVEIQPVRYELWDRFDMSAAFGINWNKGSDVFQSNMDAAVQYNGAIYTSGLDLNFMVTDRGEGDVTRRNLTNLFLSREISGRFFGSVNVGTERNDELGLRLRASGGANVGYFLQRSRHTEFLARAGVSVNREWATSDSDATNNAEGRLGGAFKMFHYDSPKSDINVEADVYPNFTVGGRWRFEGSVSGRQEIIKDLFIKLEYYESRDNKPPAGANAKSDRGLVFSIEWTK